MPDGSSSKKKKELIIAKGRDIGTGSIMKGFDGRTQKIYGLEDQYSRGRASDDQTTLLTKISYLIKLEIRSK